jgi:hypothetical protein
VLSPRCPSSRRCFLSLVFAPLLQFSLIFFIAELRFPQASCRLSSAFQRAFSPPVNLFVFIECHRAAAQHGVRVLLPFSIFNSIFAAVCLRARDPSSLPSCHHPSSVCLIRKHQPPLILSAVPQKLAPSLLLAPSSVSPFDCPTPLRFC